MMNRNNCCPECKQLLIENQQDCVCGWKLKTATVVRDRRCQYQLPESRCDMPGTMSPSAYGNSWFCPIHYHQFNEARLKKIILFNSKLQNNFKTE
ncbi:MAG: hypothetical protein ABI597_02105 [Gammaproteobacteria bacterium]